MPGIASTTLDFDWESLVKEPERSLGDQVRSFLEGQPILITGAGGYIGSALAHACAEQGAAHLVLLDIAEGSLYSTDHAVRATAALRVTPLLGSAGDTQLLKEIFLRYAPRIIFHAGAYKHVPLAESNAFAVVRNNALATATLAAICAQHAGTQLIMVSTDKAVVPAGIMGASKRIGELALLARRPGTVQRAVRLGNVLGSPGSVGPLFLEQARTDLPLTVTDPQALRYFVSLRRTTHFLLAACAAARSATLLVPRLAAPMSVVELARTLLNGRHNPIIFTGLRPGEKLAEALLANDETVIGEAPGELQVVSSPSLTPAQLQACLSALAGAVEQRDKERLLAAMRQALPGFVPGGAGAMKAAMP